jgi:predicted transposase/invertase (TIGR01784 family)
VIELEDNALLTESSRIGLVLYAAKCVWQSGNDEGKKFQYLRKITNLWAERGWDRDDKRIILLAVNYLINLKDESYAQQFVAHMESLSMNEEDKEMYVSVFERVYTARGKEEGHREGRQEGRQEGHREGRKEERAEIAKNMLHDGIPVEKIVQYTQLPREEIEALYTNLK